MTRASADQIALEGQITLSTQADEMPEGLFGQIALWVFETLPALRERGLHPAWQIRSRKYGPPPNHVVIPGFLDCAYVVEPAGGRQVSLVELRAQFGYALGNDWDYLNGLWNEYFRIPERVLARADGFGDLGSAIGLHFRGTDKNSDLTQTNPVSADDFLLLAKDFLKSRPEIRRIFAASDEPTFIDRLGAEFPTMEILHTGAAEFWNTQAEGNAFAKADHATLDCVLLSRCAVILKCQSALSGFARVLNPKLQAYRVSACKLFDPTPYFPDAYIEQLRSNDPQCAGILKKQMKGDWLFDRAARRKFAMRSQPTPKPRDTMNWARVRRSLLFRLRTRLSKARRRQLGA